MRIYYNGPEPIIILARDSHDIEFAAEVKSKKALSGWNMEPEGLTCKMAMLFIHNIDTYGSDVLTKDMDDMLALTCNSDRSIPYLYQRDDSRRIRPHIFGFF